jgi:hypothetical protein
MSWGGVPILKVPKILGQCAYARIGVRCIAGVFYNTIEHTGTIFVTKAKSKKQINIRIALILLIHNSLSCPIGRLRIS